MNGYDRNEQESKQLTTEEEGHVSEYTEPAHLDQHVPSSSSLLDGARGVLAWGRRRRPEAAREL
jgi:hypothetical protein